MSAIFVVVRRTDDEKVEKRGDARLLKQGYDRSHDLRCGRPKAVLDARKGSTSYSGISELSKLKSELFKLNFKTINNPSTSSSGETVKEGEAHGGGDRQVSEEDIVLKAG